MRYRVLMDPGAVRLIREGIDLIQASRLAQWHGRFTAEEYDDFNVYWPTVHAKYGRWYCWLAFGVGAECVLKGAYKSKAVKRGSLGRGHRWAALGVPPGEITSVGASIPKLAKRRNEGAHSFVAGVRDAYFPEVESEYLPALNRVLDAIGYPNS